MIRIVKSARWAVVALAPALGSGCIAEGDGPGDAEPGAPSAEADRGGGAPRPGEAVSPGRERISSAADELRCASHAIFSWPPNYPLYRPYTYFKPTPYRPYLYSPYF